jgi:hypothetical protein
LEHLREFARSYRQMIDMGERKRLYIGTAPLLVSP